MTAAISTTGTIRQATVEDLPDLAPLAEEFYASTEALKDFHIDRFVQLWTTLLGNGTGAIFLLDQDGEIIGTIAGVVYPEQYSPTLICQEFYLYIKKERRGGFGLLKLIRTFERWGKLMGCSQIRIGHLQDLQPVELGNLYQCLGYKPIEVNYAKELR